MIQPIPQVEKSGGVVQPPAKPPGIQSGISDMLSPTAAWRSLCARTGAFVSLVTFYRWLRNGRVFSIRLGQRIFIPRDALDDLIKQCLNGERI